MSTNSAAQWHIELGSWCLFLLFRFLLGIQKKMKTRDQLQPEEEALMVLEFFASPYQVRGRLFLG